MPMNRRLCEVSILNTGTKLIVACLLIVLAEGPAYPVDREILQLQADVIRLTQQLKELQSSVDQNNAILKALAKMADQVSNLADGLQKTDRAVDALTAQGNNMTAELRLILTNLGGHVNELQDGLSAIQAQIEGVSQRVTIMKTTVEPLPGPEDLMRTAAVDALAGNYELAVGGYMEFLSKYPNNPRSADAHFGLAETYFNQKQYDRSIAEYDLFLEKYPENGENESALYKKGLAQAAQDQVQQAVATLSQVVKKYPNTSEAANAKLKIRELRALQRRPLTGTRSTQKAG